MTTTNSVDVPRVSNAPGDPATLLNLARTGCVWFEMPGRTHIELRGADRAKFLHNFCTNDIKGLSTGNGCEAFITSIQGKILGHVFVYAEPDVLALASVPGAPVTVPDHRRGHISGSDLRLEQPASGWPHRRESVTTNPGWPRTGISGRRSREYGGRVRGG
ncbi:MAG: hypothetical protein NT069_19030 [Planctomycetota bacterium]|nr:hypothetical protein [Planctomycetota bacterium]